MSDTGAFICIILVVNVWLVAFLFHKLSFLDRANTVVTIQFWIWYIFWWFLLPYEFYKNRVETVIETNVV